MSAYTDGSPSDEVIDVLGFIACEIVRSLCEAGALSKQASTRARLSADRFAKREAAVVAASSERVKEKKRKREEKALMLDNKDHTIKGVDLNQGGSPASTSQPITIDLHAIPTRKLVPMSKTGGGFVVSDSPARILIEPSSLFSEPVEGFVSSPLMIQPTLVSPYVAQVDRKNVINDAVLHVEDLIGGYEKFLDDQATLRSGGFRNWRRGNVEKRRSTLF